MTMTPEQINAACGEAKAQGLRAVVHAHSSDGARASVMAGCTSIEHGTFLDDATLELMAQRGVYFDPNFLVLHNYLDNKPKFLGIGNYTEEGFAAMEKGLPLVAEVLKRARAERGGIHLPGEGRRRSADGRTDERGECGGGVARNGTGDWCDRGGDAGGPGGGGGRSAGGYNGGTAGGGRD